MTGAKLKFLVSSMFCDAKLAQEILVSFLMIDFM